MSDVWVLGEGRPSLVGNMNDGSKRQKIINLWQDRAWNLPSNQDDLVHIYNEIKDNEFYKDFGFDSADQMMQEKVLLNYKQYLDTSSELGKIVKRGYHILAKPIGEHGTNRHSSDRNPTSRNRDSSYQLSRIKRDNPELAEKVISGELSINEAAVKSGVIPKRMTVALDSKKVVGWILKYFNEDDIEYIKNNL